MRKPKVNHSAERKRDDLPNERAQASPLQSAGEGGLGDLQARLRAAEQNRSTEIRSAQALASGAASEDRAATRDPQRREYTCSRSNRLSDLNRVPPTRTFALSAFATVALSGAVSGQSGPAIVAFIANDDIEITHVADINRDALCLLVSAIIQLSRSNGNSAWSDLHNDMLSPRENEVVPTRRMPSDSRWMKFLRGQVFANPIVGNTNVGSSANRLSTNDHRKIVTESFNSLPRVVLHARSSTRSSGRSPDLRLRTRRQFRCHVSDSRRIPRPPLPASRIKYRHS